MPRLLLLVLLVIAVLYAIRQFNKLRQELPGRQVPHQRPPPQSQPRARASRPAVEAEDLVLCRTCGSYVAATAGACGKPGCPRR